MIEDIVHLIKWRQSPAGRKPIKIKDKMRQSVLSGGDHVPIGEQRIHINHSSHNCRLYVVGPVQRLSFVSLSNIDRNRNRYLVKESVVSEEKVYVN